MFRGKKYQESAKQIDKNALYDTNEAMELLVKTAPAKFDETVELHVKLGVDSRHADQQVRGAIVLPHGTGKTQRVLVFAKAAKADEAKAAGADYVGEMDLVEKIQKENWFDFDVVVATPDMMGVVGRLGKVLGPKGLMPSPKAGTVTPDVAKAVQEVKALRLSARQAQENYRIMQNRYMNQLAILTDLLDANSVRLDVELQLTAARTRVVYTYYQLLRACGRL